MNDLVGIAAENEFSRMAKGLENQAELNIGQILHFIHNDRVIRGAAGLVILETQQVQILKPLLLEEVELLEEQVVHPRPFVAGENGTAHAQGQVIRARQIRCVDRRTGQHTVEFLEELMGVGQA